MALNELALVTVIQAKNYLRADQAASLRVDAEHVGDGDGADLTFDLDNTPIDGSLRLNVNNVLQVETTDFSISTATITFVTAPGNGLAITATYDYTAASDTFESYNDDELETIIEAATKIAEEFCGRCFIQGSITETHEGDGEAVLRLYKQPVASITSVVQEVSEQLSDGDGSTVDFDTTLEPTSGSVKLYVDAVLQTITTHYTVSGSTITFVSAPADGAEITCTYTHTVKAISEYKADLVKGKLTGVSAWATETMYKIVYVAGEASTRAATQALVPEAVQAVLLIVADLYENRGDTIDAVNIAGLGSTSYKLPSRAAKLLFPLMPLGGFS